MGFEGGFCYRRRQHEGKEGKCLKHLLKSIDQRDDVVALEADVALWAERERERVGHRAHMGIA